MSRFRLDAGQLRHRLRIERRIETPDGCGGMIVGWADEGAVWAMLEPVSTRVAEVAQQNAETARQRIVVRFRSDLESGWRFVSGPRHFVISELFDPDERQNYLICMVEEEGR